jgi:hypothetical protein
VHEHIRATFDRDEAVAIVAVEPLHSAPRHLALVSTGLPCSAALVNDPVTNPGSGQTSWASGPGHVDRYDLSRFSDQSGFLFADLREVTAAAS